MNDFQMKEENLLDIQFGYSSYYGSEPRKGWLLNYHTHKDELTSWKVTLYFVDEFGGNFKAAVSVFPSFTVEFKDDAYSIEEYFRRKYEGKIQSTEIIEKIDTKEFNHLNKPPKKFIKISFTTDSNFQHCLREIKEALSETEASKHMEEVYNNFRCDEKEEDVVSQIVNVHEYDIPIENQVGYDFNIRCGSWYEASFDGEKYNFVKNDRITHPDLKIFAFDIETTKPPLKFPNPEYDQIMMISILTEEFGELIVNRSIVTQEIQEFEYCAKDEVKGTFRVYNEDSEETLLVRFVEVIQEHQPHIITTYNGGYFDWPFVEKRMKKYGLDLSLTTHFQETNEYYECPFIVHLDCYKWVKRDSYLPMNNQGLKDVTRIKLGYFPDEIDPEDMLRCASEDPQKLASYSVSDAVATYFLYFKYVHQHIFSICTLIPLPPVQTLCKGSGTLCEALLVDEAMNYKLLIPPKKRFSGLEYYNGHIAENMTYVGGHVESLKAGIFRSDFETKFTVESEAVVLIIDNFDYIFEEFSSLSDYLDKKNSFIQSLRKCSGEIHGRSNIYHLDVGAMYPNIILTNRLQPISVVSDDICVRCDFNDENNSCKRRMEWVSRAEYIPPEKNEIAMIRNQLENETFCMYENNESRRTAFANLPRHKQDSLLKERVLEYSKNIYKKTKKIEVSKQSITICQREVPFYVETVRKFRDQRYIYKDLYKKVMVEYESNPTSENQKKMTACNSIQVAYKCILNSFYGYAMREGSRWFSLEMAATVCNVGGEVIKLSKDLIERIGVPLELDTDGIWCLVPEAFPSKIEMGGKNISVLANILNYFVCKKYTNFQYQTLKKDGSYETSPQNSIFFEIDGPYKSMIIPSSTEENKLLKKRYVVFDHSNKIVELKGFELKRRGELNFVRKFQEDIFSHFNDGTTLQECYSSIAKICNYWLDIIYGQGQGLDDESLFYLFSESRSMSKSIESYANKKSNILSTARKLSEFLGSDILEEKLKCEFIVSKYPLNAPIADRVIPVMIFKDAKKDFFLKKWLKFAGTSYKLQDIIDWSYYRTRFESILQRLVVIPAFLQDIENPVARVAVPQWVRERSRKERLNFARTEDIEDLGPKRRLEGLFYTKNFFKRAKDASPVDCKPTDDIPYSPNSDAVDPGKEKTLVKTMNIFDFMNHFKDLWTDFYRKRHSFNKSIINITYLDNGEYLVKYYNGDEIKHPFVRNVFLEVNDKSFFAEYNSVLKYICSHNCDIELIEMKIPENEMKSPKYLKFFDHFSIKKVYNCFHPSYQILLENQVEIYPFDPVLISSFSYQKKAVYCITFRDTVFVSDLKHPLVKRLTLSDYKENEIRGTNIVVFGRSDSNSGVISETFKNYHQIVVDMSASIFLDSFENLMKIHSNLHLRFRNRFHQLLEISRLYKIPLLNVSTEQDTNCGFGPLLDHLLYKEFLDNQILPTEENNFFQAIIKEEMYVPGYSPGFCVQFESSNSLVLSIIEYKSFQGTTKLYDGYSRKDFIVFRDFIKNLVIQFLKQNTGARLLLDRIGRWIKKDSKIISSGLREAIEITHQKYLVNLMSKLKQGQYTIISASKELVTIGTEKKHIEGCNQFVEFIKKGISEIPGYELLNFKAIKVFEKLGFVDPCNYFYVDKNEIYGFSESKIPMDFLKLYFSELPIANDSVYDCVKKMDFKAVKMLLKLLSFKRDVHSLASNCYKLIRSSEFAECKKHEFNLTVFCQACGLENILRKKCLKCYSEISNEIVERECLRYLHYCWRMEIYGDRYCEKCGYFEERRLKEYCKCGGKFTKKDYLSEIRQLKNFVNTKVFDQQVKKILNYFSLT